MTLSQLKARALQCAIRDELHTGGASLGDCVAYASIRGDVTHYRFTVGGQKVTTVEFNRALAARII